MPIHNHQTQSLQEVKSARLAQRQVLNLDLIIGANSTGYTISLHFEDLSSLRSDSELASPVPINFDFRSLLECELDPHRYGEALNKMVFAHTSTARGWDKAITYADALGQSLRLRVRIDVNDPKIHMIHWERLRDPDKMSPLATHQRILFSRYLPSSDLARVQRQLRGGLRSLVLIAGSDEALDFGLDPINVEAEVVRIRAVLKATRPKIIAGSRAGTLVTLASLSQHAREGYDVIYLLAHGKMHADEPHLLLDRGSNSAPWTRGSAIVDSLSQLEQRPLLIVLASCQSAGNGDEFVLHALGPRLVGAGIPAVLAMQGSISVPTVERLIPVFFRELMVDSRIDRALAIARADCHSHGSPDWWRPILFTHLRDGRLYLQDTHTNPQPLSSIHSEMSLKVNRWHIDAREVHELTKLIAKCAFLREKARQAAIIGRLPQVVKEALRTKTKNQSLIERMISIPWGMECLLDSLQIDEGKSPAMESVNSWLENSFVYPFISPVRLAFLKQIVAQCEISPKILYAIYRRVAWHVEEIPQDPIERGLLPCMVDFLAALDAPPGERHPLPYFLELLADHLDDPLRSTVQQSAAQLSVRLDGRDAGSTSIEQIVNAPTTLKQGSDDFALLIEIIPRGRDRYSYQVWIWNGKLRKVYSEDHSVSLAYLRGQMLDSVFQRVMTELNDQDPTIEFLLPEELLNEPVNQWHYEGAEVGIEEIVVIRLQERNLHGADPRWKRQWKAVKELNRPVHSSLFVITLTLSEAQSKKLRKQLDERLLFGLICGMPSHTHIRQEIISSLRRAGTPIALWPRPPFNDPSLVEEAILSLIKSTPLSELPRVLRERRFEFSDAENLTPWQYLTLLWDNPERNPYTDQPKLEQPRYRGTPNE